MPNLNCKYLSASKLMKTIFVMLIAGLVLSGTLWADEKLGDQKQMLAVTDIHFNPFYDQSLVAQLVKTPYQRWDKVFSQNDILQLAQYSEETNPVLYKHLIVAMRKWGRSISLILFTGDILAHDFNDMVTHYTGATSQYERNKFIYKTMGYVVLKMKQAFPKVPVYFSLGNNDSYSGDYALVDDGEFLHTTADLFFKHFIKQEKAKADFYKKYPLHGYYSLPFPAVDKGRIIGLNTIFFSTNYVSSELKHPGDVELDWLEKQLAAANVAGEKVWLLLHIPPGVNVYSTQRGSTPQTINVKLQWQQTYNERYLKLVEQYNEIITASFAGHTHMDDFRLIYSSGEDKQPLDFIHITPAVTPVFSNNPAFQIISYSPDSGALNETMTYYVDLKDAVPDFKQEYVYSTTYDVAPNLSGLAKLYPAMPNDQEKLNNYTGFYYVSSTAASIANVWQWYWCGMGNLTPADYIKAYKQLQQPFQK